jgi:hypothetical protein
VVSFDRSLLKREAPRVSADFTLNLSSKRPFKFPATSYSLEINRMIAMSENNIHSAIFKIDMDTETDMETETEMERKWTLKWKRKLTIHRYALGIGHFS